MASAIGKPVSTVHSWKVRGSIPDSSKRDVLKIAEQRGVALLPEHFFPSPSDAA